jgi:hypothetical protein
MDIFFQESCDLAYNQRVMSRTRKRRGDAGNGPLQQSSPLVASAPDASSPTVAAGADHMITIPPALPNALKEAFERAADRARNELVSSGKIGPRVFFVHLNGTMKVVSLSLTDELHKELLKTRIREKALAENASAVLILAEGEHKKPGTIIISGAIPGTRASARVEYTFDKNTKTITSWEAHWLDNPLQNAFLDGIFDTTS